MEYPLLSVIIPCYNGEKCIKRCINSIIKQSYQNLEIIIINDGSTDNTSKICNNLSSEDSRIKIICQQNLGLPTTREKGIRCAKGEYITFVDVDDWIHPQMYEIMMKGILSENTDIAQCGVCNAFILPDQQIQLQHRKSESISSQYKKYDKIEGVLRILDDKDWQSYMWNKIYRKQILNNIKFPTGRFLDEDLSVMHQIYHQANSSIYFDSEFYYYLQGGVTQIKNDKNNSKKIIDRCNARWERFLFTKEHKEYTSMLNKMHNIFLSVNLAGLRYAIQHPLYINQHNIDNIKQRINENPLPLNRQMKEYFSTAKKIEYILYQKVPWLYTIAIKLLSLKK